jgi:hypothetical protein
MNAMNDLELLTGPPADLEVWLLLVYAGVVLAGARLTEAVALAHFAAARRYAEHGFHYDEDADHYHCPQGERLSRHVIDPDERVAVYRAPAASCAGCPNKSACTPHDEGRHIYRPLAAWAETDVGRFHQWLSLLMVGSATALSLVGLVSWGGRRGSGWLVIALAVALAIAVRKARAAWKSASRPKDDGFTCGRHMGR